MAGRMTRTPVIMRPFPQRGLLTSADEHEKVVAAWHEENELAEFEALLKIAAELGLPIPDKALAALSPGLREWLGWAIARAIARQYHPDFQSRGQAGRRVVWDDTRLHELVADVWYERDTTKGRDKSIFAALADSDGPYSSRWGKLFIAPQTLQNRFIEGRSCPLISRVVRNPRFKGANLRAAFIQLFALYGDPLDPSAIPSSRE
jgi:hypothetical protein